MKQQAIENSFNETIRKDIILNIWCRGFDSNNDSIWHSQPLHIRKLATDISLTHSLAKDDIKDWVRTQALRTLTNELDRIVNMGGQQHNVLHHHNWSKIGVYIFKLGLTRAAADLNGGWLDRLGLDSMDWVDYIFSKSSCLLWKSRNYPGAEIEDMAENSQIEYPELVTSDLQITRFL